MLPKLTQKEINNLDRHVRSEEFEFISKTTMRKARDQMASLVNSTKHSRVTVTNSTQTLPKIRRGNISKSFYEGDITLIPKPDKDITKKKITNQNISGI